MQEIEELWFSLSFLFIDNTIDYQQIATEIAMHDIELIEFHLFYNVAPECSANLEQTIPPIWMSFDKDELIQHIKKNGILDKTQITLARKISATIYRFKYRDEWATLTQCLMDYK